MADYLRSPSLHAGGGRVQLPKTLAATLSRAAVAA
jgi:hypothetical protein